MNNFFLNSENNRESQAVEDNHIQRYIQNLTPEAIMHLSQPTSPEVLETIESTIAGMLGNLPEEDFDVTITTNRQNLVRLIASAIINGYFLRNVEQRMLFEKSLFNS
jgi:DNA-binding GntR family transcriptional regulator